MQVKPRTLGVPVKGALITDNGGWDEGVWADEGARIDPPQAVASRVARRSAGKLVLLGGVGYLVATVIVVGLYGLMPAAPLPVLVGATVLAVAIASVFLARRIISTWWWTLFPIAVFAVGVPVVGLASLSLLFELGLVESMFI